MEEFKRIDGRGFDALRPVQMDVGIAPHAGGSVLIAFGQTRVICAATLERQVPRWMREQNVEGGWMTAEYGMLPYSTHQRKQRDVSRGRPDGRTVEIQRLIGRSLRAIADLSKLPGHTLWIDCDVLQADGGTRTAAITGAYVAARLAVEAAIADGRFAENPLREPVAAVSAGIVSGEALLDLCYVEDRDAEVDANVVMTGSGRFVELQASGEEATFSREQGDRLMALAEKGIGELLAAQAAILRDSGISV